MKARYLFPAVLAAGIAALPAAPARAQEAPVETPPPPASPIGLPQIVVPGVVVPSAPASLWTLSVRVQEQWDSNFRLTVPEEETFSERLGVSLSHAKRSPRGSFALNADGWGVLYHAESTLNAVNGTGAMSGTYELGPRTTLRGGASGASVYSPESQALAAEALILPSSRTRSVAGTMGLVQRLGARTLLTSDVRYDRFTFSASEDQPIPAPESLEDGSLLVLSASLAPQLNRTDSLVLGYDFQRSETRGRNAGTHGVFMGFSRVLARRLTASALAGASRYKLVDDGTEGWIFRGNAVLSAAFRRSALDARYDRSIDQAFGFGRDRLSDIFTAGYTLTASRNVRLRASGVVGLTRDPGDPSFRFVTQTGSADISYRIRRRIDIVTTYTYRRNDPDAGPTIMGHGLGVSLAYAREWRP